MKAIISFFYLNLRSKQVKLIFKSNCLKLKLVYVAINLGPLSSTFCSNILHELAKFCNSFLGGEFFILKVF